MQPRQVAITAAGYVAKYIAKFLSTQPVRASTSSIGEILAEFQFLSARPVRAATLMLT